MRLSSFVPFALVVASSAAVHPTHYRSYVGRGDAELAVVARAERPQLQNYHSYDEWSKAYKAHLGEIRKQAQQADYAEWQKSHGTKKAPGSKH